MATYEVEAGGKTFEVDAPNIKRAESAARLYVARSRMTDAATEGAIERSKPTSAQNFAKAARASLEAGGGGGTTIARPEDMPETAGGKLALAGTIGALPFIAPAVSSLITAPAATLTTIGTGYAGAKAGEGAGRHAGKLAERLGAPEGTASVLSGAGELAGGLAGGFGGVKAIQKLASFAATPAERTVIQALAKRALASEAGAAPAVAETAAVEAAAPAAATKAAETVATAEEIGQKILEWKTKNGWSGAQIESSLRNVYGIKPTDGRKMIQMVLEAAKKENPSALFTPRVEAGAQQVGKLAGLTKEQVRLETGPILNEAFGEASPILPKQALKSIIDKMRTIPMAEREAYVAKATSGKAQWQVENIRRTLEHLGLLLPVGAVAATVAKKESS